MEELVAPGTFPRVPLCTGTDAALAAADLGAPARGGSWLHARQSPKESESSVLCTSSVHIAICWPWLYDTKMAERTFVPVNVGVLTVSDTRTPDTDTSGAALATALEGAGHRVVRRRIVPDDQAALTGLFAEWIADPEVDVVIATGGTGITGRDVTPEALAPLVSKSIPGFGELFRHLSYAEIGVSTIQSRADAAICGTTLVFLLPGSTSAVRLAVTKILLPQLDARTRPCNFVDLMPRFRE